MQDDGEVVAAELYQVEESELMLHHSFSASLCISSEIPFVFFATDIKFKRFTVQ
jgi:hypothetical protein